MDHANNCNNFIPHSTSERKERKEYGICGINNSLTIYIGFINDGVPFLKHASMHLFEKFKQKTPSSDKAVFISINK